MSRRAVLLLSGGMDSAVAGAWARAEGYDLITLCVDYGQRPRAELDRAQELSGWLCAREHVMLSVDLRTVGGSALTAEIEVPTRAEPGIPVTYVPARNTLLLALGLGLAETRTAQGLIIGANHVDSSGYPDCRPEFLAAFERVAALGTKAGAMGCAPRVLAPLIDLSKAAIVQLGARLGVPFARTLSCYSPDPFGGACGCCDSCRLRRRGFEQAGIDDPTVYA